MIKRIIFSILFISLLFCPPSFATTRAIQIDIILSGLVNPTSGEAVSSGTVEFYEAGTTTPKNVWTEKEKTNPYTSYTLNGIGSAQLYGEGNYKLVIKDSEGGTVQTLDNIRLEFPFYGIRTLIQTGNQLSQDDFLLVNTTSGDVTINALTASVWTRPLKIQRIAGSNNIIFDPYNSETIDGSANLIISSDAIVEIISDSSNLRSAGFRSSFADADNDTKIQVEESADEDKVRIDTGGAERAVIDSTGIHVSVTANDSGAVLTTDGTQDITNKTYEGGTVGGNTSGDILTTDDTQTLSGKSFIQDIALNISDTGNTTSEAPLVVYAPNVADNGSVYFLFGKSSGINNLLRMTFLHVSDGDSDNEFRIGVEGHLGTLRGNGYGNIGLGTPPAGSGGARLTVSGEVEATALDINGDGDVSGTLTVGTTNTTDLQIGGVDQAKSGTFVNNANGNPTISDTAFSLPSNLTESAWESIGPTGSGADNIWTALDSVASGADWIKIKILNTAEINSGSGAYGSQAYVRRNGSSQSIGNENLVSFAESAANSTGDADVNDVTEATVPVNSRVFDALWTSNFTITNVIVYLIGYGYN